MCSGSGTARPRGQRGVPTAGGRAWGAGLSQRRGPDAGAVYCFFPSSISFSLRWGPEAPGTQAVAPGSLHTPEVRGDPGTRARLLRHGPTQGPRTPRAPGSRLRVGSGRPPTPRAVLPSGLSFPPRVGRRPQGRGQHEKWVRGRPSPAEGSAQDSLWSLSPRPPSGTCVAREHIYKNKCTVSSWRCSLKGPFFSFLSFFSFKGSDTQSCDSSSPKRVESSVPWPLPRVLSDRAGSQSLQIPFGLGTL